MESRCRKQFGSAGNLSIRGMGYSATEGSSYHKPNLPTPQAGRKTTMTTTLRKTGSIGNLRAVMTPSASTPKVGPKNRGMCNCQQMIDYAQSTQLQEQYTRNLQQQIYFLELENGYLRQSEKNLKGDEGSRLECSPQRGSILPIKGDVDEPGRNHKGRAETNGRQEGMRVRTRDVPNPTDSLEQHELRPHVVVGQAEMLQKLEEAYQRELRMEERLKQKIKEYRLIEEENERLLNRIKDAECGLGKAEESYSRDKRALMEEIVELQRRLDDLTPTLAHKESHIAKLENEKDVLANKLRSTTNQINTLQMKFEERKREEAVLSNLEAERRDEIERLTKNVRRLENELGEHKEKERSLIEEIAAGRRSLREEQLRAKKEKALTEKALEENNALIMENSHLSAQISRLEMTVEDLLKENAEKQAIEISSAEFAELREVEKSLRAELLRSEERIKTERERVQHIESQLEEYKRMEEETREARGRMQKELDALQALSKSLSNENKSLRQQKLALNERCEELLKKGNMLTNEAASLKHELSLLAEKNRELSEKENTTTDENSSLKHEIILLTEKNRELQEKIDLKEGESGSLREQVNTLTENNRELQQKLSEKEDDLRVFKERFEMTDRQYRQILMRLERETALQNEKAREYEQLATRVRELSASLSLDPKRSSTSSHTSHLPMLHSDSIIDTKATEMRPSSSVSTRHSTERRGSIERRSVSRVSYDDKS
uniref:Uncharacterized protein n=1 Tax=Parascaris univalens TaxID=6257 RepID=A0A914ZC44_PARUN